MTGADEPDDMIDGERDRTPDSEESTDAVADDRQPGPAAPATEAGKAEEDPIERRRGLLETRTESGRLDRAAKLVGKVTFAVQEPDLVIASVGKYNVVVDASARRIQHHCRDFQGQFYEGCVCKHVAAVLLALDEPVADAILGSFADPDAAWSLEVIRTFRPH